MCWLQTYGPRRRDNSVILEFHQGLFTPDNTALDGSCHLHLCGVDTTQSKGCSFWEVSGPYGIGHHPQAASIKKRVEPFSQGATLPSPRQAAALGITSVLSYMEEMELPRGQVTLPKLWPMAGGGWPGCSLLPGSRILAKPSDAMAGWTMTGISLSSAHLDAPWGRQHYK